MQMGLSSLFLIKSTMSLQANFTQASSLYHFWLEVENISPSGLTIGVSKDALTVSKTVTSRAVPNSLHVLRARPKNWFISGLDDNIRS